MITPGDLPRSDSATTTPGDLPRSDVALTTPRDLPRFDAAMTTPGDLPRSDAAMTTLGDLPRSGAAMTTPGDLPLSDAAMTTLGDLPRSGAAMTTPGDLPRSDAAKTIPDDLSRAGANGAQYFRPKRLRADPDGLLSFDPDKNLLFDGPVVRSEFRPDKNLLFDAAASEIGMDGSMASTEVVSSKFGRPATLMLYGLYQRVKVGRCYTPTRTAKSPFEMRLSLSWCSLAYMTSATARELFVRSVKFLIPEWSAQGLMLERIADMHVLDPNLYSNSQGSVVEPIMNVQTHKRKLEPKIHDLSSIQESKTISRETGSTMEAKGEAMELQDLGSICVYDSWIKLTVRGELPMGRFEHGSALIQDKMYIFGGNHYGRYLDDLMVLDFTSLTWSKVHVRATTTPKELSISVPVTACAGHSLITWKNCILSVGGLTKDPCGTITVTEFDINSSTWRNLETHGNAPVSRTGQSVTLIGSKLVIFGGEDVVLYFLNDLHILDLDTMTWFAYDDMPSSPCPRAHHIAACHANKNLFIFGGNNEYTTFNDLYIFDMEKREWSRPEQRGAIPGLRHWPTGVTIGDKWFIVGGWDHKKDFSETLMLNMRTLVWSVVTSVELSSPVAKEKLSLVTVTFKGEELLVAFGGFYQEFSNEVNVLRPSFKEVPLLATRNASRDDECLSDSLLDEWIKDMWHPDMQLPELENDHPFLSERPKDEKPKLHMSEYRESMSLRSSLRAPLSPDKIPPSLSAALSEFENQLRKLSTERTSEEVDRDWISTEDDREVDRDWISTEDDRDWESTD